VCSAAEGEALLDRGLAEFLADAVDGRFPLGLAHNLDVGEIAVVGVRSRAQVGRRDADQPEG
jgi:hypothetical protein